MYRMRVRLLLCAPLVARWDVALQDAVVSGVHAAAARSLVACKLLIMSGLARGVIAARVLRRRPSKQNSAVVMRL